MQIRFADTRPEGLGYQPDLVSKEEEAELIARMAALPFAPFQFHGFEGKRRTISFGWHYRFDGSGLAEAEPMPDWLLPVREKAERSAFPAEVRLPQSSAIGAERGRFSGQWGAGSSLKGSRTGQTGASFNLGSLILVRT